MKPVNARAFAPDRAALDFRLALFYGPDAATSADLAAKLARRIAPPSDPMATVTLTPAALKDDPARLADEAAAVSMFGGRRVIRIDGAGDECAEAVGLLLGTPAADNPAILVAGPLKKGSKLLALAEGSPLALLVIAYEPDARDLPRLAAEIGAELGLDVPRDSAARLIDATNGDRALLRRELEKCALFLDAAPARRQRLTIEHLRAIGADTPEADIAGLVDAVAAGRPAEADRQIRALESAGIPGITQLRSVGRRLWLLLELRTAVDVGQTPQAVVDAARPPIFWKDKPLVAAQLARWRTPALQQALERLLAAERDIKKSGGAGDVLAAQALLAIAVQAART